MSSLTTSPTHAPRYIAMGSSHSRPAESRPSTHEEEVSSFGKPSHHRRADPLLFNCWNAYRGGPAHLESHDLIHYKKPACYSCNEHIDFDRHFVVVHDCRYVFHQSCCNEHLQQFNQLSSGRMSRPWCQACHRLMDIKVIAPSKKYPLAYRKFDGRFRSSDPIREKYYS